MSVNIPMLLQSLGAMTTAFGDPQQSLQMSQNIFRQNELMRERRERAERQRAELELARQEQAAEQAKLAEEQRRNQVAMQAYAARRGGGNTMAAFDPGYGQISTAVYQPGTLPPMGSSATVARTAIDTGTTPFPFGGDNFDPNRLRSDFLSGMTGRPQGRYPAGKLALADMLANTGRVNEAMKVLADHDEQMRQEQLKAEAPTTRQRNFEYGMSLPEGPQRDRFFDFGGQEINIGGQEPKPMPGFAFVRNPETGEIEMEEVTLPDTGEKAWVYKQVRAVPAGREPLGSEEVRTVAAAQSVVNRGEQIIRAQAGMDAVDSATYMMRSWPVIGALFSSTVGGNMRSSVNDIVMNATTVVSGADTPDNQIEQRFRTYAPRPWDSPASVGWKIAMITEISRNILELRMSQQLSDKSPIDFDVFDKVFTAAEAKYAKAMGAPVPPPQTLPEGLSTGASLTGWDAEVGAYEYTLKDGSKEYWQP